MRRPMFRHRQYAINTLLTYSLYSAASAIPMPQFARESRTIAKGLGGGARDVARVPSLGRANAPVAGQAARS
jgi:hypothetical protein